MNYVVNNVIELREWINAFSMLESKIKIFSLMNECLNVSVFIIILNWHS